jgi:hypothetical protein
MAERYARIPEAVIGRRDMSATDWRVFVAVALHMDTSGRAYPSMTRIAAMAGIRRKDVPRTIGRLEGLGLLRREPRAGPKGANLYVVLDGESALLRTVRTAADCPQCGDKGVRTIATGESALLRTKHTKEQTSKQNHARRTSHARVGAELNRDGADEFERFWKAYPHRGSHPDPKRLARLKFVAALKRGADPEEIIRGTQNYRLAVERDTIEPRYIPQANTWLGDERWVDHPDAPEPPQLRAGMN